MRVFAIILYCLLFSNFCLAQTKEEKFNLALKEIIFSFSKQNSIGISKFINNDLGIYQLYRLGVYDDFIQHKLIDFSDKTYPSVLLNDSKGIKISPLRYSSLPTFDCESEWSKKGLFVDTTKISHLLSKICKERNKNVPDNIPQKRINFFYDLENKSRRIVLYDYNQKELVFYLTYINNKWYLTIIDNATSDCGV